MKRYIPLLLTLILVFAGSHLLSRSDALVNPEFSQADHTEWLAFIAIRDELFDDYYLVCSGVLVDPNWVLSSRGCLDDPFETIEIISSQNEIVYFVELWGQRGLFEVIDSISSPDGRLVMHRLNRPAIVSPIKRATLGPNELSGTRTEVPGYYSSENLGNAEFNPEGNTKVSCSIDGEMFVASDSLCYIISPIFSLNTIQGNFGIVVNPEISGPLTSPLDDDLEIEFLEKELFIDFDAGSFPCHEDIGSPAVANVNGETQLVGMVHRVGIAAGLAICTNSLLNVFSASAYYEDFIRETLLSEAFVSDCPSTTRLRLEELAGNTIRLFWEPQQSATGYKILYSPRVGYEPIQGIDVGNVTEVSEAVDPDKTYYVSLLAYNDNCTSQPSDPITILINKP